MKMIVSRRAEGIKDKDQLLVTAQVSYQLIPQGLVTGQFNK
jgi:hypothetical protein